MNHATRETVGEHLEACGVSRRRFLEFVSGLMVAAPFGLGLTSALTPEAVAEDVAAAERVHVVWLHFQECTGCTETLLRTSEPGLAELILHLISLDYHETLMAASGHQAEAALEKAVQDNFGRFVLVVEGSIPTAHGGVYVTIAGHKGIDMVKTIAPKAGAVIAIGSCASWGGVQSTAPNPTGAVGLHEIIEQPVLNLPGCPPNPYNFLGTVLQYASGGGLPALDSKNRPEFAYGRLIHEHCPRRAHFDAGRFARQFGDYGHEHGYCLYKLGCKGPVTHAACSTRHFNEIPDVWPIGIGAPCVGCTEKETAFKVPIFDKADIQSAEPPAMYPPIVAPQGEVDPVATGLAGLGVGILAGGTYVAGQRFSRSPGDPGLPGGKEVERAPRRAWRGPDPEPDEDETPGEGDVS